MRRLQSLSALLVILSLLLGACAPAPTPAPLPTATAIVQNPAPGSPPTATTGTPPTFARPTGTPPTDDVQLPGTFTPPGGPAVTAIDDEAGDGAPMLGLLVGALAVIAVGGAGAGILLARRAGRPRP